MALILKSLVALPSLLVSFQSPLSCQIPKPTSYVFGFCSRSTPHSGTDFCFPCYVLNHFKLVIKTQHQLFILMSLGIHSKAAAYHPIN